MRLPRPLGAGVFAQDGVRPLLFSQASCQSFPMEAWLADGKQFAREACRCPWLRPTCLRRSMRPREDTGSRGIIKEAFRLGPSPLLTATATELGMYAPSPANYLFPEVDQAVREILGRQAWAR